MYVCVHTYTCVNTHVHARTHTHTHMEAQSNIPYMDRNTNTHVYTHTHTHTHTHRAGTDTKEHSGQCLFKCKLYECITIKKLDRFVFFFLIFCFVFWQLVVFHMKLGQALSKEQLKSLPPWTQSKGSPALPVTWFCGTQEGWLLHILYGSSGYWPGEKTQPWAWEMAVVALMEFDSVALSVVRWALDLG